jgi:hypothetical protein
MGTCRWRGTGCWWCIEKKKRRGRIPSNMPEYISMPQIPKTTVTK